MADDLPAGFRVVQRPAEPEIPSGFRVVGITDPAAGYVQPAPPPGAIIHLAGRSYSADNPAISAARPSDDGSDPETVAALQALRARAADDTATGAFSRAGQAFTQGQSLGFGDELLAMIFGAQSALTGGSFTPAYDYAAAFQRQEMERQRAEHPLSTLGLEAAGGLATAGALASQGATVLGRMTDRGLSNLLPRMAAGAGEGAAYGAASGFGHGDGGLVDRGKSAAEQGLLGALFGGAAVPAVDATMELGGRAIGNALSAFRNPEGRSEALLVDAMRRDQVIPEDIARLIEGAGRSGQTEFVAADAGGRNMRTLAGQAARTPGSFREDAAQIAAARQAGQGDRIQSFVDEALGNGRGAYQTEQAMLDSRRAAVAPLYREAYRAAPPMGDVYTEMLGRRSVQEAVAAARRIAAERQSPISDLFVDVPNPNPQTVLERIPTGVIGPDGAEVLRETTRVVDPVITVPTMAGWDAIKRELDARVTQLYRTGDTTAAEAVRATRNQLRTQLAQDVPAYARALAQYADDTSAIEAIQSGRDLARMRNTDAPGATFGDLSAGQQDFARIGAAREIGVRIENMRTGQDKTGIFDTPVMQNRLDALIPDPAVRSTLNDRLARERSMVMTNRQIAGGGSGPDIFAEGGAVTHGVLGKLARGNVTGATAEAAGRMLGFIGQATRGMNENVARRVGDYLLSSDPAEIRALTAAYEAAQRGGAGTGQFITRLIGAAMAPDRER